MVIRRINYHNTSVKTIILNGYNNRKNNGDNALNNVNKKQKNVRPTKIVDSHKTNNEMNKNVIFFQQTNGSCITYH